MVADAGMGVVRMDMFWPVVDLNMKALFILDYGNPLYYDGPGEYSGNYGPASDEYQTAYANFAAAAASHFDINNLIALEIWNEPNVLLFRVLFIIQQGGFWVPHSSYNYSNLAYKALQAIKEANPNMPVMLGGTSGVDNDFIEEVLTFNDLEGLDFISVHPYRSVQNAKKLHSLLS